MRHASGRATNAGDRRVLQVVNVLTILCVQNRQVPERPAVRGRIVAAAPL
jgi:hypothetical protein